MVDRFLNALMAATARVTAQYFRLPVAAEEQAKAVYRERVYCYELYHHLRNVLDCERLPAGYALNGEIDKQAHPFIRRSAPDFLFHVPGDMNQNLVVVEVKPINAKPHGIKKDVKNLAYFVSPEVGYRLGVMLVYGDDGRGITRFENALRNAEVDALRLLWQRNPGERAKEVGPNQERVG
jgi:hypothetical protein